MNEQKSAVFDWFHGGRWHTTKVCCCTFEGHDGSVVVEGGERLEGCRKGERCN